VSGVHYPVALDGVGVDGWRTRQMNRVVARTRCHLYYDAWSPVDYTSGTMNARYMTGSPGDDDYLLDFTQLTNGNLVFVGTKGTSYGYAPIWVFVTDSTRKKLLFNKGFFPRDSTIIGTQYPRAVTATPDNGFTVVGYINHNCKDALAMHFVPKPVSAVVSRNYSSVKSSFAFNVNLTGSRLVVLPGSKSIRRTLWLIGSLQFPVKNRLQSKNLTNENN
jgi:hypothetical protein